jgi:hypothetical protein
MGSKSGAGSGKPGYQGHQSGKSSSRWFGGNGHPKGYGASAGDGRTSVLGIVKKVIFKSPKDK